MDQVYAMHGWVRGRVLRFSLSILLAKKKKFCLPNRGSASLWFCPRLAPKHVSRPRPRSAPTPLNGYFSHARPCSADPGAPPPPVRAPLHR